jgi:hypothetical protein
MTVNGSAPDPSLPAPRPRAPRYCPHDGAREIRMYMSYGDANAVRLRLMIAGEPRWRHVSAIYEIPNGWAWMLCNQCPADERREAVGE